MSESEVRVGAVPALVVGLLLGLINLYGVYVGEYRFVAWVLALLVVLVLGYTAVHGDQQ